MPSSGLLRGVSDSTINDTCEKSKEFNMKLYLPIIILFISFVFAEPIEVFESSRTFTKSVSFGSSTPSPYVATVHIKKAGSIQYEVSIDSVNNHPYWENLNLIWYGGCYASVNSNDINNLPRTGITNTFNMLAGSPQTMTLESYVYPQNNYSGTATCKIIYVACPASTYCSTYTCPACNTTYCVTHDTHITANYSHGSTVHLHCTNSQTLANEWVAGCQGHCDECGQTYCKLCSHRCGDDVCPNLAGCNQVTCQLCSGVYCSKHNFHVCGNYTTIGENIGNDNISVQTTITGEAQVSVNITDNSHPADLSNVESSLNQINTSIGNINNNVIGISSHVFSIDSAITSLNTYLPNQLQGMNANILDIKDSIDSNTSALNDTLESIDLGINSITTQNHNDIDNLNTSIETMQSTLSSDLQSIGSKLDNLELDGDFNVNMQGVENKLTTTNTKLDAILNGNGNLGLGSVGTSSPSSGVGSIIVENGLTGGELENIQEVTFIDTIKRKLTPPQMNIGNFDASFSFNIPTLFGEPLHLSIDMNDERLNPVRHAVRGLSSVCMVVVFTLAVVRMIRQY